jgi:hypothetical protein
MLCEFNCSLRSALVKELEIVHTVASVTMDCHTFLNKRPDYIRKELAHLVQQVRFFSAPDVVNFKLDWAFF